MDTGSTKESYKYRGYIIEEYDDPRGSAPFLTHHWSIKTQEGDLIDRCWGLEDCYGLIDIIEARA